MITIRQERSPHSAIGVEGFQLESLRAKARGRRRTTIRIGALATILSMAQLAQAGDTTLRNKQEFVIVHSEDGSYEIGQENHSAIHARVAVRVDENWVTSSDYPQHEISASSFDDALGHGHEATVRCSGLRTRPDLSYVIRLYDNIDAGEIRIEIQNHTEKPVTVQSLRSVEAIGDQPLDLSTAASNDRVLSDSFSEDWPPLKIYDLGNAPGGMHRAVGSQLIYNRESKESVFFGALTSNRFLTIIHLQTQSSSSDAPGVVSYTVDSTGTTEIQATDPESGLREGSPENLIELSV